MRRRLVAAAAAIAVLLAVGGIAAYAFLRRSLPTLNGTVIVTGLSSPVEIVRDADAIPHVLAANRLDAFFGLGYVHAQDRLWQMELQRRIGHGRLSEIFGADLVPQDRFLRTVGFGRAARSAWKRMPASAKAAVDAYVAGVNAFLHAHGGSRLPPEFTLLRLTPEPWSGEDVVVWVKMMAWDLSANYTFELLRSDLVRAVGVERMRQLMPFYAEDGLSIIDNGKLGDLSARHEAAGIDSTMTRKTPPPDTIGSPDTSLLALFKGAISEGHPAVRDVLLGGSFIEALGSNNWVVDGTLSATGKPLLANDPHLSTKIPSTWYLAHLSAGDFEVIGATLPGIPAIALGRNRFIAWGATNVSADVQDLYSERLDESGTRAMFGDVAEPLTIVPETIRIKGGNAVTVDVRLTRHGPLISDAINAINAAANPARPPVPPLALRWTALDEEDTTLPAFLGLNEARNWTEFTTALRDFVVPSQNFVYADAAGHIGYYAPGRIPIRARGDGSAPGEGWTGADEWIGWVPFDKLPHRYDPPEHFIVTANDRPAGSDYPYTLGVDWPESYRAARIIELMHGRSSLTADDFARIQSDTISLHVKELLPLMLRHAHPATDADRKAADLLNGWNGDVSAASSAAPIFEAWFLRLPVAIVEDDLGTRTTDGYNGRFSFVTRFLRNTLNGSNPEWCDDRRTEAIESCDDIVTAALHEANADVIGRLGADMSSWRWDTVHRVIFPHQGLDSVAGLGSLLRRSIPNGGDWSTVNVGTVSTDRPYEQRAAAGYRSILDLSPNNDNRFVIDLGQSGHPLSRHYDDFLRDWQGVRHRRMRLDRTEIEHEAIGHLRLVPE
jgi:penicillin G amidase